MLLSKVLDDIESAVANRDFAGCSTSLKHTRTLDEFGDNINSHKWRSNCLAYGKRIMLVLKVVFAETVKTLHAQAGFEVCCMCLVRQGSSTNYHLWFWLCVQRAAADAGMGALLLVRRIWTVNDLLDNVSQWLLSGVLLDMFCMSAWHLQMLRSAEAQKLSDTDAEVIVRAASTTILISYLLHKQKDARQLEKLERCVDRCKTVCFA